MISIIICSTHRAIDVSLSDNIKDTIGRNVDYEIISIDNSDNRYSIFSAYNEGVKRAKGEYLCFMHEDIIFHSVGWGRMIAETFKDGKVGMLGVLGTAYFSPVMSSWWNAPISAKKGKVIQGTVKNGYYETYVDGYENYTSDNFVVAVDGLWMCIRKSLFQECIIRFDDKTFSGFHFYDIDISFQVVKSGYKIEIVGIDIEHRSFGKLNDSFFESREKFQDKWFKPLCCDDNNKNKFMRASRNNILKHVYDSSRLNELTEILNMALHKMATKIYILLGKQL